MKFNMKTGRIISTIIFIAPALIIYSAFRIIPALSSFYYGFTDWNGLSKSYNFVGFQNFIDMFHDDFVLSSITNTIKYSIMVVIIQNALGLLFAILVDNNRLKGKNFFRTVLFLPSVLNTSAICFIWAIILSPVIGIWKPFVHFFSLEGIVPNDLLGNPSSALYTVALVNIWQYMGYSMMIYLSGLQTVPKDLYEAAEIDGCNYWGKFKNITLPMIAPSITINVILCTIGTLKQFEHIYILTNGGPGNASQVIGTAIYKVAFNDTQQFGYGIAISTILMIFIGMVSMVQMHVLKKGEKAYG